MDYAAITNRLLYQLSYVGMDFWIEPVAILNALSKCVKPHTMSEWRLPII